MIHTVKRILFMASLSGLAVVSGCGTAPTLEQSATPPSEHQELDPEKLLARARVEANKNIRNTLLMQSAQVYWEQHFSAQAKSVSETIDPRYLSNDLWQQYWTLLLDISLLEGDRARLEKVLPVVQSDQFFQTSSDDQRTLVLKIEQGLLIVEKPLEAAILLIEHYDMLYALPEIQDRIWTHFKRSDLRTISTYTAASDHYEVKGWLALAKSMRLQQRNIYEQYDALQQWRSDWSLHTAANELPHELQVLSNLPESQPTEIVLALPFSGPLANVANAIKNGLLASYYAQTSPLAGSTQSAAPTLKVSTFDTHIQDFMSLYDGHLSQDTIIIGPLKKETIRTLLTYDRLPIKTLALNYVPAEQHVENLYQFSLNPEHETRQVVERMASDGYARVGLLLPENDWGIRIYDAFNLANTTYDNTVVETAFYSDQKSLSSAVAKMLATDKSKDRARMVRAITNLPLETLPRRRQDIDAVFMAAKSNIAKQLKPLLAYHYASDLPVFATSQINNLDNRQSTRDLNGIQFVDMPWSLSTTVALRHAIEENFPATAGPYSRFYAMGIDAFQLAPRIELLGKVSNSHLQGMTGELSIDEQQTVQRKLQWATFRNGKPYIN